MSESHTLTTNDLQSILNNPTQWEKIDRIVLISFKSFCDLLAVQSLKIEKLEKSIEYLSQITQSSFSELTTSLELKVSFTEAQQLLEKKVSKSDLSYILSNKPNFEDLEAVEKRCVKFEELNNVYSELLKRWEDTLSKCELEDLYKLIETKAIKTEVEEALQGKANKQAVANALHKKVSKSDIENLLSGKAETKDLQMLSAAIEAKVEYSTFENFCKETSEKLEEIDYIKQSISECPQRSEIKAIEKDLETQQQTFFDEVEKIKLTHKTTLDKLKESMEFRQNELSAQISSETEEKISIECSSMKNFLKQKTDVLEGDVIKLTKQLEKSLKLFENDLKTTKENSISASSSMKDIIRENQKLMAANNSILADVNKLQQDIVKVQKNLEDVGKRKSSLAQVQELINLSKEECYLNTKQEINQASLTYKSALTEESLSIREDIKSSLAKQDQSTSLSLEKKVSTSDFINLSNEIANLKRSISGLSTQEEVDLMRDSLESLQMSFKKKSENDQNERKKLSETLENIYKDLAFKATSAEVLEMLDPKVTVEEVNKSIAAIYVDLEKKMNVEDFELHVTGQSVINEALCAENRLARWVWKNGDLSSGNVVWDVQTVNTSQDTFVWDKGKIMIQILQPGLYQIEYGFFAKKKPTIGVIVNGETAIIGGNSMSAKPWGKQLTSGITLVDFLVLPNRSRICIAYSGEPAEGFFGIRKL